jgi:DNA polymerase-3 subunit delta
VATELSNQYGKIMQDLKAKRFAPIYILHGEETFFVDAISGYIEQNALTESEKGFNQTIFYAKDLEPSQVIEAARRFPMMAEKQVIIVKEAQNYIFKESKDAVPKKSIDAFEKYLNKPVPSTILVLCIKGKKLDKRTAFYKEASKHIVFESAKLYEKDLLPWIKNYIVTEGYTIGDKSVQIIADSLGNDLSKISNELDKLFINKLGSDKNISEKDIDTYIGISKDFNSFELLSAIAAKNSQRAFKIGHHLAKAKDFSIIPFVAILSGMFSKGYIIRKTNTTDKNTIMKAFGLNYFSADDYVNLVKNFQLYEIEKVISICSQYDLKSKGINSVAMTNQEMLKEILIKIM